MANISSRDNYTFKIKFSLGCATFDKIREILKTILQMLSKIFVVIALWNW